MKHFVVKDAMAPLPRLATDAENAWRECSARRCRRGAVPMCTTNNKTMRILFDVLKAPEDF